MRTWRYAYNTNGLVHHRLEDAVDLVADLGYEALSLTPDVGHLDPRDATAADVARFDAHLRRRGLGVSMQTGARFVLDTRRKHQPTLLDPDPAARKTRMDFLIRCLDMGRDLGARTLSFWSGAEPIRESVVDLTNRLVAGCRALSDAAAARGMVAAFEPEPGMWVARVDHWSLLHRTVDHPAFKLAMDVGHVHCNREGDPAWLLRGYRAALGDVQVEDARVGQHVHLPFGEGTLDIGPTLIALNEIGYQGHCVVELSRDSHRAVEVATAAIAHMKRYVP
jgi:sugar phosphate isomerase/epimerase